ncbi:hypothetical protein CN189_18170 [Sinorhizobium meliloti]|nr:hypothetical protein CN189_18170 [Sinorhizobium meliloti]
MPLRRSPDSTSRLPARPMTGRGRFRTWGVI